MATADEIGFPTANDDERELLLSWLRYLRGAVLRNAEGLDDEQGRWHPEGTLVPVAGVVAHLTHVEWRWIDGGFRGADVSRSEAEFSPVTPLSDLVAAYRARAAATEDVVRSLPLTARSSRSPEVDLRWVLLHLLNETARHCGHADATRELLDGTTGE